MGFSGIPSNKLHDISSCQATYCLIFGFSSDIRFLVLTNPQAGSRRHTNRQTIRWRIFGLSNMLFLDFPNDHTTCSSSNMLNKLVADKMVRPPLESSEHHLELTQQLPRYHLMITAAHPRIRRCQPAPSVSEQHI